MSTVKKRKITSNGDSSVCSEDLVEVDDEDHGALEVEGTSTKSNEGILTSTGSDAGEGTSTESESDDDEVDPSEWPLDDRKRRKTVGRTITPIFIAVHLGAGEHSLRRKNAYKVLCDKACKAAMLVLRAGLSAGEAVAAATVVLEDSGIVNAGRGSSLTECRTVECDAGFMIGSGHFGAVGAAPGIPNPILAAKQIAEMRAEKPLLSCGRVPPTFLAGEGAKSWAQSNGIPVCSNEELISKTAAKMYERFTKMVDSESSSSEVLDQSGVNDTVGAVALDMDGRVASTVSSGGNWLKQSGRIGHAPQYGCGCWSTDSTTEAPISFATSCSGAGEMLSKVHLPRRLAKSVRHKNCFGLVHTISTVIQEAFLDSSCLKTHAEPKNVGLIALIWDRFSNNLELAWGHTSQSMVIAYAGGDKDTDELITNRTKMVFSTLSGKEIVGKSIKAEGVKIC